MPEDKVQEEFPKRLAAVPEEPPKTRTRPTVREKVAEILDPAKVVRNEMGFTVEEQNEHNVKVRALLELFRQGAAQATGHKKDIVKVVVRDLDKSYVK